MVLYILHNFSAYATHAQATHRLRTGSKAFISPLKIPPLVLTAAGDDGGAAARLLLRCGRGDGGGEGAAVMASDDTSSAAPAVRAVAMRARRWPCGWLRLCHTARCRRYKSACAADRMQLSQMACAQRAVWTYGLSPWLWEV